MVLMIEMIVAVSVTVALPFGSLAFICCLSFGFGLDAPTLRYATQVLARTGLCLRNGAGFIKSALVALPHHEEAHSLFPLRVHLELQFHREKIWF